MGYDTYTVITQLEFPVRASSKEEAIDLIKIKVKMSPLLSTYAGAMTFFIPPDPDYDPTIVDTNRGMLE